MKHPSEYFLKYLLIKDPTTSDAQLEKTLTDWSILRPPNTEAQYFAFLRQRIPAPPDNFNPHDITHRASMKYLREQGVYEMFHPNAGMSEAWSILSDPSKRLVIEQVLLARLDAKTAAHKINKQHNWRLTEEAISTYGHYFWNVQLLTFDDWGRFLYGRSAMYERYMVLLTAPQQLVYFHLRLEQALDSKRMIQRTQEIAYYTLEEVAEKPGTGDSKIKAIGVLGKTVIECHNALSTSDMALKEVLKDFERFRMEYPQKAAPDIRQLAPAGNHTGSGVEEKAKEKEEVPR